MNLRRLEFPRHVHKLEAGQIVESRLVANVAACEAAIVDGYTVIPPGDFVDDEPPAPAPASPAPDAVTPEPPKRKPGRPPKQQEG